MELFKANKQWSTRPQDERFTSIQALYDVTRAYYNQAVEKGVNFADMRCEAINGEVQLVGRQNNPAKLTNWAFGQVCARLGAPASYLRDLPATLAVQNLNHGLAHRIADAANSAVANLLLHVSDNGLLLRALTTDVYQRIWNWEVAERLLDLEANHGFEPATPDIRQDLDPNGNKYALYASDHDLFAFIRSKDKYIVEAGSDQPVYRGVIYENSEVGASKIKATKFFYREMCGNHIIWGASNVIEVSARHVGSVREKFEAFAVQVREWMDESVSDDEGKIKSCKTRLIAATKDEVLDALFGKKSIGLSRKQLEAGYDATNIDEDGDPRTPWGIVQGLTRYSQTEPYADKRTEIDRAAGRILDVTF